MTIAHLPHEPFDVRKVRFYAVECKQSPDVSLATFYTIWGRLTGRSTITLELWAYTEDETTESIMQLMEQRGSHYLKRAKYQAQREGYLVADVRWAGVIASNNLTMLIENPRTRIWELASDEPPLSRY